MVMNQNAAAPITARITTSITSLRSIGAPFWFYPSSSVGKRGSSAKPRAARRADGRPPICDDPRRLRRLLAVGLMATAAILAHLGNLNLEAVEILGCVHGRLGLAGKLGEPGVEIGFVFPDRRKSRGVATGLGIVREECGRLLARLGEGREHLFRGVEIEGLLGLQHVGGNLALVAVGLHQRLAGSDGIALSHQRGGPEREHCNDERSADHLLLPLWVKFGAG